MYKNNLKNNSEIIIIINQTTSQIKWAAGETVECCIIIFNTKQRFTISIKKLL